MRNIRRLVPAVVMLLISAILLSTATYAWFSMNTQVIASNIAITAKSNARYLLINDTNTAASGSESLTLTTSETVYPASYEHSGLTLNEGETNELVIPAHGWYTANNRNSNNSTNAVFNESAVTEGDDDYMATDTMYLTLSADSEDWDYYVAVTVTKNSGDAAAKVVLKVTNGSTTTYVDAGVGGTYYIDCTTTALSSSACITVVVYTYIDGDSTNVYSDFTGAPSSLTGEFALTFDLTETNS